MKTASILLIAAVLIGGLLFVYKTYFVSVKTPDLQKEGPITSGDLESRSFLIALMKLKNINFSAADSVFSDPAFTGLVDMSVSLPDEPVGRTNPFNSLGDESASVGAGITPGSSASGATGGIPPLPKNN